MRDRYEQSNTNNISGNVFNAPININSVNDGTFRETEKEKKATYTSEPIWRSPITLALLTWISVIIALIEIFPFYKTIEPVLIFFTKGEIQKDLGNNYIYAIIFIILFLLLISIISLSSITKREIRCPLLFNYAINGYGRKITIEKIYVDNCPKCGGKMKYYSKPVEWIDKIYSDGKIKREIIKRVPALQCKRNPEHWYEVDPAESKLK